MSHAVLTGDIVNSSAIEAAELDVTMQALHHAAIEISGWNGHTVTGFARRGGDGWQIAMERPELAMRAALFLQAILRRLAPERATRIAIAFGDGALPTATWQDPNKGHGDAFTASGRLIDHVPRHALMAHAAGGLIAATLRLADHISQGWTQAQARALVEALPPDAQTRAKAAAKLGISRQAVNQALWSAGYPALTDALEFVEKVRQ